MRKTSAEVDCIVSTGYGRRALEISCEAVQDHLPRLGTQKLYPAVRTIIDIGGQDSKIIALDEKE